jgi:hypothetical protein
MSDSSLTPTAIRVIGLEILVILLLWAAQRHFGL